MVQVKRLLVIPNYNKSHFSEVMVNTMAFSYTIGLERILLLLSGYSDNQISVPALLYNTHNYNT